MMKRIVYNLLMGMLVVSTIVTALGIAYLAQPDFFNWLFDWLELTEAQRAYLITGIGGTTIMAWTTKVLKVAVNTDQAKRDLLHKQEMSLMEQRYQREISLMRSDFGTLLEIVANNQNQIIANDNVIIEQNNLLIGMNDINATRMVSMSDELVPIEVKTSYKEYLAKSRSMPKIDTLKHFYVENKEIIKEVAKPVVEAVKKRLSDRYPTTSLKKEVSDV